MNERLKATEALTDQRAAGVLLHPTSLPGPYGIGDLGSMAQAYIDWLARAGMSYWQVLPLNPPGAGNSPYSASSAFASNPLMISPERLVEDGLLTTDALPATAMHSGPRVDWDAAIALKHRLLQRAWEQFRDTRRPALVTAFDEFRHREQHWLDDWALFASMRDTHPGLVWTHWPAAFAHREPSALRSYHEAHEGAVAFHAFQQFLFARQWDALRRYARQRGLQLFGDVPIYVTFDSVDVWAHRHLFQLDDAFQPQEIAGVPPDYFNEEGQLWGNPLFDWGRCHDEGYNWWIARIKRALSQCDLLRLDHFRGFVSYWSVPFQSDTAKTGRWVPGPGKPLFDALKAALGQLPLVAEDLGDITADVNALRDTLGLPGMAILQFAFAPEPRSEFVPYAHRKSQVVYTGTHDNNTVCGWWDDEATPEVKQYLAQYLGHEPREIHTEIVRLAYASRAFLAIVPHQDLVGLGASARMNTPGEEDGHWSFRLHPDMASDALASWLQEQAWVYGRKPG